MNGGFFDLAELPTRTPLGAAPNCAKCGLLGGCTTPKMPVAGQGNRKIMVIGEAPGETEDRHGRPFIGKAGQKLQDCLRAAGIELFRDCWVTNALSCRPPGNKIDNDNKIVCCRPLVIRAIEKYKPETIILAGGKAVKSLIGYVWKEEVGPGGRWTGWRIPCQQFNCWICPIVHPSYLNRLEKQKQQAAVATKEFLRHLRAASKLKGRPFPNGPIDYESKCRLYVDPDEAIADIRLYMAFGKPVAWDIETTCKKPTSPHAEIVCCSISDGSTAIAFPWSGQAIQEMLTLLKSNLPKMGWNIAFETTWLLVKHGVRVQNFIWDGMMAAHSSDARPGITGLEFQEFIQLGIADHKSAAEAYLKTGKTGNQPNKIKQMPIKQLLLYNALDSLTEAIIDQKQMKEYGYGGSKV